LAEGLRLHLEEGAKLDQQIAENPSGAGV